MEILQQCVFSMQSGSFFCWMCINEQRLEATFKIMISLNIDSTAVNFSKELQCCEPSLIIPRRKIFKILIWGPRELRKQHWNFFLSKRQSELTKPVSLCKVWNVRGAFVWGKHKQRPRVVDYCGEDIRANPLWNSVAHHLRDSKGTRGRDWIRVLPRTWTSVHLHELFKTCRMASMLQWVKICKDQRDNSSFSIMAKTHVRLARKDAYTDSSVAHWPWRMPLRLESRESRQMLHKSDDLLDRVRGTSYLDFGVLSTDLLFQHNIQRSAANTFFFFANTFFFCF